MTDEEKAAIRARVEAATAEGYGWHYGPKLLTITVNGVRSHTKVVAEMSYDGDGPYDVDASCHKNGRFLAHARTDVPALLDALEAAEAERDRYRELLVRAEYAIRMAANHGRCVYCGAGEWASSRYLSHDEHGEHCAGVPIHDDIVAVLAEEESET